MKSLLCILMLHLAAPCAAQEAVSQENSALHIVQNKEGTPSAVEKLQQTNEINMMFVFALLAVLFIVTFFSILDNTVFKSMMQERAERKRVASLRSAIEGFEQEFGRIGRALHDEAESRMSTAFLAFSSFQGIIFKHQPEEYKHFATSMASLRTTIRAIMRQAEHLAPFGLEENGLALALKELVATVPRRTHGAATNIALSVNVLRGKRFERHRELTVYRVVQAIVSNSLQYAQAELLVINFAIEERHDNNTKTQWLLLTSQDDGRVFSTEGGEQNAFGLSNMRNRIHALGGTFHIHSASGYGTTISAGIPMI